jgi:chromosome segregation ATPase
VQSLSEFKAGAETRITHLQSTLKDVEAHRETLLEDTVEMTKYIQSLK